MLNNDFCISSFDSCVYFKHVGQNTIYFLLYIDDILIAYTDYELIQNMKCMLKTKFEMKELSPTRKILGMEIIRDRKNKTLFLSQKN